MVSVGGGQTVLWADLLPLATTQVQALLEDRSGSLISQAVAETVISAFFELPLLKCAEKAVNSVENLGRINKLVLGHLCCAWPNLFLCTVVLGFVLLAL